MTAPQATSHAADAGATESDLPLLRSERIWSFRRFSGMNVTLAIATWAFLQGGAVALYVGAKGAIASIVIGYGIAVLLVALAPCVPTAKYGVEMYTGLRSVFGVVGAKVVMIVMTVLVMAAWTALLAIMVGHALANVMDEIVDSSFATSGVAISVAALLAVVLAWVLLVGGPQRVGKVGNIAAPVMVVITLGMLVLIFDRASWSEIASAAPLYPMEDQHLAFMLSIELNVAGGLAWYPMIGNLARLTDTPRASFWPNAFGLFAASSVAAVVGVFAALALGSDDPTVWMIPLGGAVLGVAVLAFIAFANLTSMVAEAYSGISAITGASDRLRKIAWPVLSALFLVPVVVICLFPESVYNNYGRFLSWVAIVVAPMCGVQVVDYFVLRRARLSLRDLYLPPQQSAYGFWAGWNWVAFVAVGLGALTYVALLHPVNYEPNSGFQYVGASIPALVVAGVVHWFGTLLVVRRTGRGGYATERSR
ncbi:cytosine permease [Nocardioides sp. LMS-CY]|uniref:cytosine permease n=1 Tax=Nocardioides sp. (strain LMS-CY) TaxID=2840457 RepID=UPI001C00840F|nr:cytosine permease [Nocardioides sp. LMS-CY]QWF23209.1 cytosine permease [Nocardioides sp. LMS-CY]